MHTHIINPNLKNYPLPTLEEMANGRLDLFQFLNAQATKTPAICDQIPDGDMYHRNYLNYLEGCWARHWGAVVSPTILWHLLLAEVALIVQASSEEYRNLFTRSSEQTTIKVLGSGVEMPLDRLIDALREHVPSDVNLFFPSFTTDTASSKHAMRAVFADICSPFYKYTMLCCGIPKIRIDGDMKDWIKLVDSWKALATLFFSSVANQRIQGDVKWFQQVRETLEKCLINLNDPTWWGSMFKLQRCGSGSDVEVDGWIRSLYRNNPRPGYVRNFSTTIGKVRYKNLDLQKDFVMQSGLFASKHEDGFMVPMFGYLIHQK